MVEVKDKDFKAKMNQTRQSEKAEQQADDLEALEEVVKGRQTLYIEDTGQIIFDFPPAGLAIQGDQVAASFKSKHLRNDDILTEAQLKAIYGRPVEIKQDGVTIKVGDGCWTDKHDRELDDIPKQLQDLDTKFSEYRIDFQRYRSEFDNLSKTTSNKAKRKSLEDKMNYSLDEANQLYNRVVVLKARQLELNATRAKLFADSLEEQCFFEKVKLFLPSCVKKRNEEGKIVPLWSSAEAMMEDSFGAVRIMGLFNLFMRGLDVSFFGDAPEGQTSESDTNTPST